MDNTDTTKYDSLPVYCNGVRIDVQYNSPGDNGCCEDLYKNKEEVIEEFDLDMNRYNTIQISLLH
jgi:hypothetical protein